MTIKRTPLGELFMVVVVDSIDEPEIKLTTGKIAGFDFGLKTFLTSSDGSYLEKSLLLGEPQDRVFRQIESPQFFKQSLNAIRKANRHHSKKLKGSSNRERARKNLVRAHEDIINRRSDSCQSENDRDENASLNIKKVGSSTLGVGDVRQSQTAISV